MWASQSGSMIHHKGVHCCLTMTGCVKKVTTYALPSFSGDALSMLPVSEQLTDCNTALKVKLNLSHPNC